jgi:peptide/nickel transport system substrate-binding protein
MKRRFLVVTSLLAVLAIVGSACSKSTNPTSSTSGGSGGSGGTYRTATQEFGYTDAFDPTGEYLGTAWGLYGQLLIRGLMTYNHKSSSEGGDTPVPDIATAMPQVSSDGLTYTFKLRTDVMFGPPVNRAVTSHDIEYAFERINLASLAAQYGNYYDGVIKGMTGAEKSLHPVSGISTPSDDTIVFHLAQPTGDLLYRLSMPATAAIPQEVAKCFTKAGDYGRYVISDGPYMIMGEDQLDISSCSTMKPISGYNPDKGVTFVRNTNFKDDSESSDIRGNSLDGIQIAIDSNVSDIFQQIQAGTLDGSYGDTPPSTVEQQYATDPTLKSSLHSDEADRTWYLTLNPLAAPFDDVHVRRAVEYVLDKASMAKAFGGSLHGVPATAIEPPTVNAATATQNIYPSTGNAGDVNKALGEMKQSSYAHDSSGKCTDAACKGFIFLGRSTSPWPNMDQVVMTDLAKIGLDPKLSEVDTTTGYTTMQHVAKLVPLSSVAGWGKDFADPYGFDYFILDSAGIGCTTAVNYYLVGLTAALAKECGVTAQYNAYVAKNGPMLSVDNAINTCEAQTGDARQQCFGTKVDAPVMKSAVIAPWNWANNLVITGTTTTKYEYDANAGTISLCWVTVNNGLAPVNVAS